MANWPARCAVATVFGTPGLIYHFRVRVESSAGADQYQVLFRHQFFFLRGSSILLSGLSVTRGNNMIAHLPLSVVECTLGSANVNGRQALSKKEERKPFFVPGEKRKTAFTIKIPKPGKKARACLLRKVPASARSGTKMMSFGRTQFRFSSALFFILPGAPLPVGAQRCDGMGLKTYFFFYNLHGRGTCSGGGGGGRGS